jgi:hypothetical protein
MIGLSIIPAIKRSTAALIDDIFPEELTLLILTGFLHFRNKASKNAGMPGRAEFHGKKARQNAGLNPIG